MQPIPTLSADDQAYVTGLIRAASPPPLPGAGLGEALLVTVHNLLPRLSQPGSGRDRTLVQAELARIDGVALAAYGEGIVDLVEALHAQAAPGTHAPSQTVRPLTRLAEIGEQDARSGWIETPDLPPAAPAEARAVFALRQMIAHANTGDEAAFAAHALGQGLRQYWEGAARALVADALAQNAPEQLEAVEREAATKAALLDDAAFERHVSQLRAAADDATRQWVEAGTPSPAPIDLFTALHRFLSAERDAELRSRQAIDTAMANLNLTSHTLPQPTVSRPRR
ncbi:MAG TPA: hypothetical protein VF178_07550 [Gemmatimonadaceae bacterium]